MPLRLHAHHAEHGVGVLHRAYLRVLHVREGFHAHAQRAQVLVRALDVAHRARRVAAVGPRLARRLERL